VKRFAILVSKCDECPNLDQSFLGYTTPTCLLADNNTFLYKENRDGITPSCPMWSEAVEVEE